MKKKLAIFDVDFTITRRETLMELYRYSVKENKRNIRYLPRALYGGIMYLAGVYDEKRVKESFLKFIDNMDEKELKSFVKRFYENRLSKILYNDSIEMIKKLKSEGYDIYLISASPEFYLNELYSIKEIDKIIGTRFAFEDGKFKRKMIGKNCKGAEKVVRLNEVLKKENIEVDYENSYMFSDSLSDKPLLDLVGNAYLINYKKNTDIEILKWK